MSKIKAALITLMLGSSTAAMASPSLSFSANAQVSFGTSVSGPISGPAVRDHRYEPAPTPAPVAYPMPGSQWTSWVSLGSPLSLSDGRDVVKPSLANMNISQLRLQATSGMSYVQKVQIRFKDGTLQNLMLNKWLTNRAPMLDLDIAANHRGIDSITVLGTTMGRNASYQLFAQGNRMISFPHSSVPTYGFEQGGVSQQPAAWEQAPVNQTPVTITSQLIFANTQGFRHIYGGANLGTFSTLQLKGEGGPLHIAKIIVSFVDGQTQTISVDRDFAPGVTQNFRLDSRGMGQIAGLDVYSNDTMTPIPNVITGSVDILAF